MQPITASFSPHYHDQHTQNVTTMLAAYFVTYYSINQGSVSQRKNVTTTVYSLNSETLLYTCNSGDTQAMYANAAGV
jgi:hypothetical protein